MVMSKLKSLEKRMALERAEQQVTHEIGQFLLRWEVAQDFEQSLPDPHELIKTLLDEGFYLRSQAAAFSYLWECRREKKVPGQKRLIQILLPWAY